MSNRNKGKSWDEIFGIEGAKLRRAKQSKALKGRSTPNKGKKWEDIYSPEEVKRRKETMHNNNPSKNLSDEQKRVKSEKISKNMRDVSGDKNPFFGKTHTVETKNKIRRTKESAQYKSKMLSILKDKKEKAAAVKAQLDAKNRIIVQCRYCGADVITDKRHIKHFCNVKCQGYHNIYNGIFKKGEPNSWERKIINFGIPNVEYVGDHSFWIDLKNTKGDIKKKNPDFIVKPFSSSKKVIEVIGKFWHPDDEIKMLKKMYKQAGISVLFVDDSMIESPKLKSVIERFICK